MLLGLACNLPLPPITIRNATILPPHTDSHQLLTGECTAYIKCSHACAMFGFFSHNATLFTCRESHTFVFLSTYLKHVYENT